jgi:hypothetical protein
MPGVTPVADVVDAPTIGTATAGIESATVTYTAAATGGAATSFTAISTPGSITGTGSSPITVSGLTAGTAYTFQVYGTNASGTWSNVKSAASNSVTPTSTAFESIATINLGSSSSTITFSGIPQTYSHLQVRLLGKVTYNAVPEWWRITMLANSSASAIYHNLEGGSGSASSGNQTTYQTVGMFTGSHADLNNMFGIGIVDIPNYASTTKTKTARARYGFHANTILAFPYLGLSSLLFNTTSAITSLTFQAADLGTNLAAGTTIALYGIKGA